jgi:hypothetical protein
MDDFSEYERLRDLGFTPKQVHEAAKADGLDSITRVRLIRRIFDLSLGDAKRAIGGGDWFEARPVVKLGTKVYWEEYDSADGCLLFEARVTAIDGPLATLAELKKFRLDEGKLAEVPLDGPEPKEMPVADLERSLAERLEGWEGHIKDLIEATG